MISAKSLRTTMCALALGGGAIAVSGCAALSGYDANSTFSCKAPEGVSCQSMGGVYANAMQNNLPGQRVNGGGSASQPDTDQAQKTESVLTKPIYSGTPIRSTPEVLRVWFAPWEDSAGDLHDQSYVYVTVNTGHWLIEHNRRRIQDSYRPSVAPTPTAIPSPAGTAGQAQGVNSTAGSDSQTNIGAQAANQTLEQIGTIQAQPSPTQAAAMMQGITTPNGQAAAQGHTSNW